jgi:hypothetical protein
MATWKLKADARDVRDRRRQSGCVQFFSPRPAVDHVVACLSCSNAAEQRFVCQHGGAPLAHRTRSPWRVLPRARPRRPAPSAYTAPTFEVIRAAGTLDGEASGPCVGVSRKSLERSRKFKPLAVRTSSSCVRTDNHLKVRFFAMVGEKPEVEVALV